MEKVKTYIIAVNLFHPNIYPSKHLLFSLFPNVLGLGHLCLGIRKHCILLFSLWIALFQLQRVFSISHTLTPQAFCFPVPCASSGLMFTLIFFSHLTLIMRFTMTNVFNIAPCLLYSLVLLIILKHCLLFFLLSDLTFSIMLCNSLTMFHVYCLPPISYKISSMKAEFFGSVMNVKYTQQCLTP